MPGKTVPLRAVCLTGPTACGKTDLALELAGALPLEIVSVDSAMVYRGMDIGTAKPSAQVRAAVPHHLIDIVDPAEAYSAGRFLRDAVATIEDIAARGRLPLLVGGTLLYLRALRRGLAPLPPADPEIRAALNEEAARDGWPALHARLARADPEAAARIAPSDRQRIQRALEVYTLTGRPLSDLQRRARAAPPRAELTTIALLPGDRRLLAEKIERRFDAMVEAGLVGEVETLRARGDLNADMPSMRAVGYRQMWSYLANRYDWGVARAKAIAATRQLAKRQMTWLRSEAGICTYDAFSPGLPEKLLERVRSELERWA
ncbi:MAG TPA: tRNA (adenosine(37)-N6)-dimethylallyltransferase MiaA [Gammaproteobacteria bacterium]